MTPLGATATRCELAVGDSPARGPRPDVPDSTPADEVRIPARSEQPQDDRPSPPSTRRPARGTAVCVSMLSYGFAGDPSASTAWRDGCVPRASEPAGSAASSGRRRPTRASRCGHTTCCSRRGGGSTVLAGLEEPWGLLQTVAILNGSEARIRSQRRAGRVVRQLPRMRERDALVRLRSLRVSVETVHDGER